MVVLLHHQPTIGNFCARKVSLVDQYNEEPRMLGFFTELSFRKYHKMCCEFNCHLLLLFFSDIRIYFGNIELGCYE
jgi:hypothetical protein